ncbi:MAG: DNA translocase FtsK [Bacteroidales bacterium]|jgi:S-DNA-T family DNA segregation ATPase FtsK/SpoIIIE|nr:DNA translocase FtsK [Bacteroidales bacterium]OQB64075.1 MAG: DNA translocase SpoIIIE [Bacteroidetes bacterium ADurb.Bin145]HOU02208.1 DNA translocase FtsK 4TM domain-containing protein [Bacteroidales bacterium]HQK68662.1 DNA translocase FtsK 4TM domain-containing protein [Bacteroidales bacterium]
MSKEKEESMGKSAKKSKDIPKAKSSSGDEKIKFVIGVLIAGFALYLLLACIAYLFWWKTDLSLRNADIISGPEIEVKNWSGKSGHFLAKMIIGYGFGFGAFFIPVIFATIGLYLLKFPGIRVWNLIAKLAFAAIIVSLILSYIFGKSDGYLFSGPGGAQGYIITRWLNAFMGKTGTGILLGLVTIGYLVFALKVPPSKLKVKVPDLTMPFRRNDKGENASPEAGTENEDAEAVLSENQVPEEAAGSKVEFLVKNRTMPPDEDEPVITPNIHGSLIHDLDDDNKKVPEKKNVDINITKPEVNDILSDEEVSQIMENYDPRLDLSRYKFPPVSILKEHKSESTFDNKEVFENKENIIKTLGDHKISIRQISATVGPTVTLYEIVPERGVRLARIKSLEDDIALNLSALGIRIIAPIPGRGTVGIEVPNKNPEMVSMRSLITSKTFQESRFDIALALGRTITNDPYIVDLTKMPHLLVAGATGQGKSVGINAIITSILYKKHPAEVKFVLIDPKRVELPLYSKIERHFLAKLPGEEDAIITDTQKVINTLNSLCIEMDNRLELLKGAQARNIKEYNEKFVSRKLNPEKGHKYLPYIVLIIDEFADLIMTAGREIEGPIGRLAQLARAIGIHLIISTQRPSTNIITGFIKANFPTRIAFRVFSSIDSRTILDATGADRLVGRGDMLVSSGNEPVRVQCAFIDTPEIEELTEFIGSQQGYPDAMHLPEYIDDSESSLADVDLKKRDPMFDEAARLVVQHQQGSTSLIQRKLSIGYNRAGRIIDQLEAAGIVGPFEGSKARDVLCSDMIVLEQILKSLD